MPPRKPEPARPAPADTGPSVRTVRIGAALIVAAVLGLVFGVPRAPPPPPSPASPNEAFVDDAHMVTPAFARQWAGGLLNDPRAQIIVYTTPRLPEGGLSAWTVQTATDWKIGSAKEDTGIVLFVFRDARIARAEVGYGLEGLLPDVKIRQLLERTLLEPFSRGAYEPGIDAWLHALRDELGGDAGLARAAEAEVTAPSVPFYRQILSAYPRIPKMLVAVGHSFREEGAGGRFAILIFAGVALGIAAVGIVCALNTVWRLATLPRNWHNSTARPKSITDVSIVRLAGDIKLMELLMGPVAFAFCFVLTGIVVVQAESYFTRKGHFGGAGAEITWPAVPR